jgi:signal transduction histidine kinase
LVSPARIASNRFVLAAVGAFGLVTTFGGMVADGRTERLGTIGYAPWVALLGAALGARRGAAAGAAAAGLYYAAGAIVGTAPTDALSIATRLAALTALGAFAGLGGTRLRRSARSERTVAALQSSLIDSTLDGICLTDPAGNVLIANAPLRRLAVELGLPPRGTIPERLLAVADTVTEPERYRARMRELAENPEPATADEFEQVGTGRAFRGYTAPVRDEDGGLVGRVWTLRDVTADRELERLRDRFVATVSHELRTPLTSISGFLELLADEEDQLSESARSYLAVIDRSTRRLHRLVEDLLLVAQIEARRLELDLAPLDLAPLAAAAVAAARPAAEAKELRLELETRGETRVRADPGRLEQVLDNLLENAIKFTGPGGRVTVSTEAAGQSALLSVADTGIGVPAAEQERLFSRFFRASTATRRAIPGTGLGLAIARAIVEQHGGTIGLDSHEGAGTRVTVALPAIAAEAVSR